MSKINLTFKGKKYSIDRSLLAGAVAELEATLSGLSGGGDDYNHDDPALHPTEIQEGAVYLNVNTGVYSTMPTSVSAGDIYLYQDYMYAYGLNHMDGWQVALATDDGDGYWNGVTQTVFGASLEYVLLSFGVNFNLVPIDQASYGAILESINGVAVTDMRCAFRFCKDLTQAPVIPDSVTSIELTFQFCESLTQAPVIPNSVTNMTSTFRSCTSLTQAPVIPDSVTSMDNTFHGCTSLTQAPTIPNSVTNMMNTFNDCTSLTQAPAIPNSVTNMEYTFSGCTNLTQAPAIPDGVTNMMNTFNVCTSLTQAPAIPNSVTNMMNTFNDCTSLTQAPAIPNSVTNMEYTFYYCTSLTGDIEINANPTVYNECFGDVDFQSQNITLTGSSTMLDEIGATGNNYCAECNGVCKGGH